VVALADFQVFPGDSFRDLPDSFARELPKKSPA